MIHKILSVINVINPLKGRQDADIPASMLKMATKHDFFYVR